MCDDYRGVLTTETTVLRGVETMGANFWALWKRSWQKLTALTVGLALVVVHVARNDPAALTAGTFLVSLGLFIDRLDELTIGALKAKLIRQLAEEQTRQSDLEQVESPQGTSLEGPSAGVSTTIPLAMRTLELPIRPRTPSRALASRPGDTGDVGWVSLRGVANARTTEELVAALASYAEVGRALSRERRDAERETMGAIMELQAERARKAYLGENTPDEQEAADEIGAFWSYPESLTDEEVRRLAALVRRLIARDQELFGQP